MRRLAADSRYRRPRRQDRSPNGLDDGQEWELLTLAGGQFDVFVTVDRNLSFQQNVVSYPIAVIVLRAKTNRLVDLKPLAPRLVAAIQSARSGVVEFIDPE